MTLRQTARTHRLRSGNWNWVYEQGYCPWNRILRHTYDELGWQEPVLTGYGPSTLACRTLALLENAWGLR